VTGADQVTEGHQLLIRLRDGRLAVTCPCLLTRVRGTGLRPWQRPDPGVRQVSYWKREVIEARRSFPVPEAVAAWRDWHEREGIPL
jgi:hypothetical protein